MRRDDKQRNCYVIALDSVFKLEYSGLSLSPDELIYICLYILLSFYLCPLVH